LTAAVAVSVDQQSKAPVMEGRSSSALSDLGRVSCGMFDLRPASGTGSHTPATAPLEPCCSVNEGFAEKSAAGEDIRWHSNAGLADCGNGSPKSAIAALIGAKSVPGQKSRVAKPMIKHQSHVD